MLGSWWFSWRFFIILGVCVAILNPTHKKPNTHTHTHTHKHTHTHTDTHTPDTHPHTQTTPTHTRPTHTHPTHIHTHYPNTPHQNTHTTQTSPTHTPLYCSLQVSVWYSGAALLQLTGGRLVKRDCFTAAYSVAVCYSGTALLQLTLWQFGIVGLLYCSLQCGSLV
jgi:hypothetical protein